MNKKPVIEHRFCYFEFLMLNATLFVCLALVQNQSWNH